MIGYQAGRFTTNHDITGCVFIGHKAGYYENNDDRLYIDNSSVATPLVFGDFSDNYVTIHNNLGVGSTAFASGVKVLSIENGTPPSGSIKNGILLWAEDVSLSSELRVRNEANVTTTLSPHNFSMIKKSEPMAWSFYSEHPELGKKINVDMLYLVRTVEEISGKKIAHINDIEDNSIHQEESYIGIIQELRQEIAELKERIEKLEE